jgi:hypothetical protein
MGPVNPDSAPTDSAIAGWVSTTGGSATQTALDFRYGIVFNVLTFGAVGDGTHDDTAAIQAAIDAAMASSGVGGKIVYFPTTSGHYHYTHLNIIASGDVGLTLQGANGGSYLRCINTGGADDYSITIEGDGADPADITGANYLRFVTFRDLKILGNSYWNDTAQQPSAGINIKCAQFVTFENVWIGNFSGPGLWLDANWDSYYENVNLLYNGHATSDSDYAYAWRMTNTCNALVFNKVHVEQYSLALSVDTGCRLNDWIGCKFEDGGAPIAADGTTQPIFAFIDQYENTFTGGLITVDRSHGKVVINASQSDSTETTTWNTQRALTFHGTKFVSSHGSSGGKWFKGSHAKFLGCTFNRSTGAGTTGTFWFEGGCVMKDCQISVNSNEIGVFRISAGNNQIVNNQLYLLTGATSGSLFTIDAAYDNNIVADLSITGQHDSDLALPLTGYIGASRYALTNNPPKTVTAGANPSTFLTDQLTFTYPSAVTVLTFNHGTRGKLLTIRATNTNCTIQNNSTTVTKTGANVVMTAGQTMQFLNDGGVWREV